MDDDGNAFRCPAGELERCRHDIGILGFVNVQSIKTLNKHEHIAENMYYLVR